MSLRDKEANRLQIEVSGYIEMLPLEYRGSQPVNLSPRCCSLLTIPQAQRLNMEAIINKLMDKPNGSSSEL